MFTTERRQAILEFVRVNGVASLRELAAAVDSSEVTIRRDVRALEAQGLVDRRRGAAAWPGGLSHEQSYVQKTRVAAAEKAAIARVAAGLVSEGDAIVVGAGTTTREFALAIAHMEDLTVVTNSILVAEVLATSNVQVVVTGGALRGPTYSLVGGAAEESLTRLRVRYAFLSGNGLTAERGLSTPNMLAANVDHAIAACAQEVIVLADHTKIGIDTMFQTIPVESISHLVTDAESDPATLEVLTAAGVQVHVARVGGSPSAVPNGPQTATQ